MDLYVCLGSAGIRNIPTISVSTLYTVYGLTPPPHQNADLEKAAPRSQPPSFEHHYL